ncbi:MAG: M17 family peptidase N-terminal domain-containing protein, partial [Planctomycetota bacterium]
MTPSAPLSVTGVDLDAIQVFEGCVAVFLPEDGKLDQLARRVNRVTRGALERFASSEAFSKLKPGEAADLGWPAGMEATSLRVVRLDKKCTSEEARAAGASVGKSVGPKGALLLAGSASHVRDMALGAVLRAYKYTEMQSSDAEAPGAVTLMVSKPEQVE